MPTDMKAKTKQSEEIEVPAKLATFVDKRTNVRSVAFPFTFPDGTAGGIVIMHLNNKPWQPSDDIEGININFKV